MNGAEIMDIAHENGCIIGPSHAFTPWTSIYKEYDSIWTVMVRYQIFWN